MGPLNRAAPRVAQLSARVRRASRQGMRRSRCARTILTTLARRAYRRPVTDEDMSPAAGFYNDGAPSATSTPASSWRCQRILVSPSFLFRTEFAPRRRPPPRPGRIASAISSWPRGCRFFLWSSIPDDELLDLAIRASCTSRPYWSVTPRMLADRRSAAFTENFAGQWLSLRRLVDIVPDPFLFPDYGDTLARAFQKEAELFFDSIVREDRPTVDLLTANYTFVNERLAEHYGILNVKGVNFQRVTLAEDSPRRGLLGKGAILTVTALPNRTSPVVRGKWVLQTILGAPPPEPPPDVPSLQENGDLVTKVKTLRQRLEVHRAGPICASCHKLMDPIGFALESFDAVGKYRTFDENFEPSTTRASIPTARDRRPRRACGRCW
jgi:hypothetical protein